MPSRPGSVATVDYSTQGDPDQSAHSLVTGLVREQTSILNTRNYLLPDGTGRRILDIPISKRKPFVLENGHAAYQIQLGTLEPVLETSTYLLDRFTGQFHMVYDDGYRKMATTPMLLSTWCEGQLVAYWRKLMHSLDYHPKMPHHLQDNLQQVSTYHQQSSRDARVMPRTQQKMMKLYQI